MVCPAPAHGPASTADERTEVAADASQAPCTLPVHGGGAAEGVVDAVAEVTLAFDEATFAAARARGERHGLSQASPSLLQQVGVQVLVHLFPLFDLNDDQTIDEKDDDDGVLGGEEHVGVAEHFVPEGINDAMVKQ